MKDDFVVLFVYDWSLGRLLVAIKLELVDHFNWALIRIHEVDLDAHLELSPPSLVNLKWKLFDSYCATLGIQIVSY